MSNKGYLISNKDTERTIVKSMIALSLPLLYFHKNRKVLLSSAMAQKSSSYYNP